MTSASGVQERSVVTRRWITADAGELIGTGPGPAWYAIWTRSHSEQLVKDQLDAKGFQAFLPTTAVRSMRRGQPRTIAAPLFPGYLFVHDLMDKHAHVEILKARGVVRILGERWDRLETISDEVMEGIQRLVGDGAPVQAWPHLPAGTRVRITAGPFAGLRGFFVRDRPSKGLFVLSIDLLQRSVAVEVDHTFVEAL